MVSVIFFRLHKTCLNQHSVLIPEKLLFNIKYPCNCKLTMRLTLKVLNFWKFTRYCSLKSLWSGMGEVVPTRTSPTLHPPSPPTVHPTVVTSTLRVNMLLYKSTVWNNTTHSTQSRSKLVFIMNGGCSYTGHLHQSWASDTANNHQPIMARTMQDWWQDHFISYSASHDNWCTGTLWNRIMTAQCEGMGEEGSVRYEPALLPPCPSIRVLSYSNCQEIHSRQQTGLAV